LIANSSSWKRGGYLGEVWNGRGGFKIKSKKKKKKKKEGHQMRGELGEEAREVGPTGKRKRGRNGGDRVVTEGVNDRLNRKIHRNAGISGAKGLKKGKKVRATAKPVRRRRGRVFESDLSRTGTRKEKRSKIRSLMASAKSQGYRARHALI